MFAYPSSLKYSSIFARQILKLGMKNKETIIGWVLIVLLMLGFVFYQQKKAAEEAKAKKEQKKTEQAQTADKPVAVPTLSSEDSSNTAPTLSATGHAPTDSATLQSEFG